MKQLCVSVSSTHRLTQAELSVSVSKCICQIHLYLSCAASQCLCACVCVWARQICVKSHRRTVFEYQMQITD